MGKEYLRSTIKIIRLVTAGPTEQMRKPRAETIDRLGHRIQRSFSQSVSEQRGQSKLRAQSAVWKRSHPDRYSGVVSPLECTATFCQGRGIGPRCDFSRSNCRYDIRRPALSVGGFDTCRENCQQIPDTLSQGLRAHPNQNSSSLRKSVTWDGWISRLAVVVHRYLV